MPLLRSSALALALVTAMLVLPMSPSHADTAPPTCNGSEATVVGTNGDDDLTGTDGPDVVWLGGGDDVFHGLGGGDQVCPGTGKNQIYTGPGNDYVYGVDNWDQNVIRTGQGDDSVLNIGGTFFLGSGHDVADSWFGDASIHAGPGPDIVMLAGAAHAWLGSGADHAYLLDGSPVAEGGPGRDVFNLWSESSPEDETSFYGAQALGGAGFDTLDWQMAWPMRLDVGAGRVTSHGDILGSDRENDTKATFHGVEQFVGGVKNDVMIGHAGRDHLQGSYGNDIITGLGGSDVLSGGEGNDRLIGGAGRDLGDGGPGRDTCRTERRHACERH